MSAETFLTKYRPLSFEEVIGHQVLVEKLRDAVRSPTHNHVYLFTGPSGVGKTTLARIIGTEVNATINKIDASTQGGVDDIRQLVSSCQFKPITNKPNRLHIIDECHAIGGGSAKSTAWNPLLDLLEHPQEYSYFCLCTTDPQKIPETIKTRAYHVPLKSLKPNDISDLLVTVCDVEGWAVDNDVFQAIIRTAQGSARKALSLLQAGHSCKNKEELSEVVSQVESEDNPAIKLVQYLMKGGGNWRQVSTLMREVEDEQTALVEMCRYLSGAIIKSEETQVPSFAKLLHALTHFSTYDAKVNFVAGITWFLYGNVIF